MGHEIASSLPPPRNDRKEVSLRALFQLSLRAKRGNLSSFCSCLIHQVEPPNKLGNYIFKLCLAMTQRVARAMGLVLQTGGFLVKIGIVWAVSSVVRALASHARGHWFKSSTAHFRAEVAEWQTRYVQDVVPARA